MRCRSRSVPRCWGGLALLRAGGRDHCVPAAEVSRRKVARGIQASGSVGLGAMLGGYCVLSTDGLEYEDLVDAREESES